MARRVSGLTVESRLIEVRAIGRVGDPTCVPSPDDCCGPRGTACCPTPPADVLLGTATGPVATGGGVGDFDLILVRPDPSAQVWESGPTFGSGGGTSELDVVLGCDPVFGWWLEGELTPAGQATVQFRILLFEDSAYLTGDIYHPALSGLVLVALEHPCPSGSGSGSGGSGTVSLCGCSGVPLTVSVTFTGSLSSYATQTLTWNQPTMQWMVVPPGGACNGGNSPIGLACQSGTTWILSTPGGGTPNTTFSATASATTCSPLSITFSGTATGSCAGAFTATVSVP